MSKKETPKTGPGSTGCAGAPTTARMLPLLLLLACCLHEHAAGASATAAGTSSEGWDWRYYRGRGYTPRPSSAAPSPPAHAHACYARHAHTQVHADGIGDAGAVVARDVAAQTRARVRRAPDSQDCRRV